MREGTDVSLIAFGKLVGYNLKAAEILEKEGISCEVCNQMKPFFSQGTVVRSGSLHVSMDADCTAGVELEDTEANRQGCNRGYSEENPPNGLHRGGLAAVGHRLRNYCHR